MVVQSPTSPVDHASSVKFDPRPTRILTLISCEPCDIQYHCEVLSSDEKVELDVSHQRNII